MSSELRIRDVYQQYLQGEIPFDQVVRAADEILESYEASRVGDESTQSDPAPRRQGRARRP